MAIGALLSSSYLQLLSAQSSAAASQKTAPLLPNGSQIAQISPRTGPDTYTPSQPNGSGISIFGVTPYSAPERSSTSTALDPLAAAKATAQKDAEAVVLAEQNHSGDAEAALGQLSKDMAALASAMRDNSVSQSADLVAHGASNTSASDSIAISINTPYGSIAAVASDSANPKGSAEMSSVAWVSADGTVEAAGQGSVTTADGVTKSASVGFSATSTVDADHNASVAFGAYASLSVSSTADTTQKLHWVAELAGSASSSGKTTSSDGSSAASTQNQSSMLVMAAYGGQSSSGSYGSWARLSDTSISLYA